MKKKSNMISLPVAVLSEITGISGRLETLDALIADLHGTNCASVDPSEFKEAFHKFSDQVRVATLAQVQKFNPDWKLE